MKTLKIGTVMALSMMATLTYADNGGQSGQTNIPGAAKGLSWDEFRESCTNPAKFHSQRPPENIKVICKDVRQSYVPMESGSINLPSFRVVGSQLLSDKYYVTNTAESVGVISPNAACAQFKGIEQTLNVERVVTCDDILANQLSLRDTCVEFIDSAKNDNIEIVATRDNGQTISTCSAQRGSGQSRL
jgi:hypothetical protein